MGSVSVTWRGEGDAIIALYDEQKHWHIADQFNHDPKTIVGIYGQHCLWMLGYPDQAVDMPAAKMSMLGGAIIPSTLVLR